ncbi:MAG: hypothetical protein R2828_01920 [Saprospiraceae bacterium]
MKNILLLFCLFTCAMVAQGQTKAPLEKVVITSKKKKTQVSTNEKGDLQVNVSPKNILKFKAISGSYSGQHDFGYTCYMPEHITIENLQIDDSNHPEDYQGPAIFTNFNPQMTDESYQEKFPYVKTREVIRRKVTTASGKALRVSDNPVMFKEVKVDND